MQQMQILPPTESGIVHALNVLRDGGVVAHATETCYGLACDLTNPDAVTKLFAIKKRPSYLPVSVLFASLEQAKQYVLWNAAAEDLSHFFPGPLTVILPLRSDAPHMLYTTPLVKDISDRSTPVSVGVRISSASVAQTLVDRFGRPLSTTSANVSSLPSPYSVEEIVEQFRDQTLQPDLILDSGKLPKVDTSTVIDCAGSKPVVLRQGGIRI